MDTLTPKDHAEELALFRAEVIGSLTRLTLKRGELAVELRAELEIDIGGLDGNALGVKIVCKFEDSPTEDCVISALDAARLPSFRATSMKVPYNSSTCSSPLARPGLPLGRSNALSAGLARGGIPGRWRTSRVLSVCGPRPARRWRWRRCPRRG